MLDACAPGYTMKERDHNYVVRWNGRAFPSLPKGPHGKGERAQIQIGHVKKMVRALGIDFEAATEHIPRLKG